MKSVLLNDGEVAEEVTEKERFEDRLRHLEILRSEAAKRFDDEGRIEFKSIFEMPPPTFGADYFNVVTDIKERPHIKPVLVKSLTPKTKPEIHPRETQKELETLPSAPPLIKKTIPRFIKKQPTKNFVKENTRNISRSSSRKTSKKETHPKLPEEPKVDLSQQELVIRSTDYLNQKLSQLKLEALDKYRSQQTDTTAPLIKNSNLLNAIFSQFTDLIAVKWEEAADALIDEMLTEEVERLNLIDSSATDAPALDASSYTSLLAFIDTVKDEEQRLAAKYQALPDTAKSLRAK